MTLTDSRTPSADPGTTRGVAQEMAAVVTPLFGGTLPLRIRAWDGSEAGPAGAPTVVVNDSAALRRLVFRPGELGLAQAYVTGEIDVEGDLLDGFRRVWQAVRESGASPRLTLSTVLAGLSTAKELGAFGRPPEPPGSQARLRGRLHSLTRDRDAISHHYDLSNDFYALILDPHMAYSCAYFTQDPDDPTYTVEDAQRDKLDLVCRKLGLHEAKPGHRHLDIGCGWGSLSLYAAETYGVQVVGVTIAKEQKAFIDARIAERGLQGRVEIRLQDYRDVAGRPLRHDLLDRDGRARRPARTTRVYTGGIHGLLEDGGRALIQQMSRTTRPGGGPFIEAFIAPDMHMRPVGETVDLIEQAGLEVRDVHALREHYVRTVDAWYGTFEDNWDRVVEMVGEEVARVWRLYLVGGALAFEEGRMGVDQILMVRPTLSDAAACRACAPSDDRLPVGAFLGAVPFTLLAVVVVLGGTFLVALRLGRHAVVDVAWGLGFAAIAVAAFLASEGAGDGFTGGFALVLTVVWGRAPRGAHRAALARSRRGPALRRAAGQGARQPAAVRAAADLPHPGRGDVVRVAARCRSRCSPRARPTPRPGSACCSGWSGSSSRPSATCSSPGSATTRPRRARCSTPACGATPGTRTTSATPASGGACP